jgi:hypothetical protein
MLSQENNPFFDKGNKKENIPYMLNLQSIAHLGLAATGRGLVQQTVGEQPELPAKVR